MDGPKRKRLKQWRMLVLGLGDCPNLTDQRETMVQSKQKTNQILKILIWNRNLPIFSLKFGQWRQRPRWASGYNTKDACQNLFLYQCPLCWLSLSPWTFYKVDQIHVWFVFHLRFHSTTAGKLCVVEACQHIRLKTRCTYNFKHTGPHWMGDTVSKLLHLLHVFYLECH